MCRMTAASFTALRALGLIAVAATITGAVVLGPDGGSSGSAKAGIGFPPDSLAGARTVWAVGDGADGSSDARAVAAEIASRDPDRFLYLGDVYDNGTAWEFENNYAPVYGRFDEIAAPTPGNHEWGNRRRGYKPYWRDVTGEAMPPWYVFYVSGWQVLSLNSEAPHGRRSPQLKWLRQRLRATPGRGNCRIAFWHQPRYSAGIHGNAGTMEAFWRALAHDARIVINGHDHNMQRFRARRGIVAFVAGSGGHSPTSVDESDPRLAFAEDFTDGALRLDLEAGRARHAFVSSAGDVLDSGNLRCRPGS